LSSVDIGKNIVGMRNLGTLLMFWVGAMSKVGWIRGGDWRTAGAGGKKEQDRIGLTLDGEAKPSQPRLPPTLASPSLARIPSTLSNPPSYTLLIHEIDSLARKRLSSDKEEALEPRLGRAAMFSLFLLTKQASWISASSWARPAGTGFAYSKTSPVFGSRDNSTENSLRWKKHLTCIPLDRMFEFMTKLLGPMSGPMLLVLIRKSIDYL
jgi:hypothetical protein